MSVSFSEVEGRGWNLQPFNFLKLHYNFLVQWRQGGTQSILEKRTLQHIALHSTHDSLLIIAPMIISQDKLANKPLPDLSCLMFTCWLQDSHSTSCRHASSVSHGSSRHHFSSHGTRRYSSWSKPCKPQSSRSRKQGNYCSWKRTRHRKPSRLHFLD